MVRLGFYVILIDAPPLLVVIKDLLSKCWWDGSRICFWVGDNVKLWDFCGYIYFFT